MVLGLSGLSTAPSGAADAGSISGTVTRPDGSPMEGVVIEARSDGHWPGYAVTGADGSYTVSGLTVSDTWRICFWPPEEGGLYVEGLTWECWDDTTTDAFTPVSVTAGNTTTGIDAQLEVGATISGTVTVTGLGAPQHRPDLFQSNLVQAQMILGEEYRPYHALIIDDVTGEYEITGLRPGHYTICTFMVEGYVSECYDNAATPLEGTTVTLGFGDSAVMDLEIMPEAPAAPQRPSIRRSGNRATVSWPAVAGASRYQMRRNGGSAATVSRPFVHALPWGGTFRYEIRACNAGGCSAWSPATTVVAPPARPAPKMWLRSGKASLRWNSVSGAVKYQVSERGRITWAYTTAATDRTPTRVYYVRACNRAGCSAWAKAAVR